MGNDLSDCFKEASSDDRGKSVEPGRPDPVWDGMVHWALYMPGNTEEELEAFC